MPDELLDEHIDNLERIFGRQYLANIGFFHLAPERQHRVLLQIIDLLGGRLRLLASSQLDEGAELHRIEMQFKQVRSPFEMYDLLNRQIPGFEQKVEQTIEDMKRDLLRAIDGLLG